MQINLQSSHSRPSLLAILSNLIIGVSPTASTAVGRIEVDLRSGWYLKVIVIVRTRDTQLDSCLHRDTAVRGFLLGPCLPGTLGRCVWRYVIIRHTRIASLTTLGHVWIEKLEGERHKEVKNYWKGAVHCRHTSKIQIGVTVLNLIKRNQNFTIAWVLKPDVWHHNEYSHRYVPCIMVIIILFIIMRSPAVLPTRDL